MKYTKLHFYSGVFTSYEVNSMNGYAKNKLHSVRFMFVDSDKLEIGKEKFKKELLKYYNGLIKNIEEQI